MRRAHLFAVALGATSVFLLALAGNGQEKLGLAGPGDSLRLALLRSPEVQKELALDEEQNRRIARISELTKEAKKQVESAHGKGQEKGKTKAVTPIEKEQQRLAREAMNGVLARVEQETDQQINAVLNARQRTRLTQIALRVEGPSAFLTPELIDALGLVPDQVDAIREILGGMKGEQDQFKESQKRSFELAKAGGAFDVEKIRKDRQKAQTRAYAYKLSKQVMAQIGRVLTRRQRETYNRMLGEPFELARLSGKQGLPLFDESDDLGGSLLREPAIQAELKLTPQQKERLSRGEPAAKVLDASQQTRLRQITLQSEGPAALIQPDVARALRLNDEQVQQTQDVLDELVATHRELRDTLKAAAERVNFDESDPAQAAKRKEQEKSQLRASASNLSGRAMQRINAVLSRRQREAAARLFGETFDFAKLRTPPVEP
jgi:hypothetical protein